MINYICHIYRLGGINPPNARDLHLQNIQNVYEECLRSANMKLSDVDAIAVTVEPGLPLSLIVGRDFALNLSRISNKPLIPIHHMKAHALTARMTQKVDLVFYLVKFSNLSSFPIVIIYCFQGRFSISCHAHIGWSFFTCNSRIPRSV